MADITAARRVYAWANDLAGAQIDLLSAFHFFHHGVKQNYDPNESYVVPRGMLDCPRDISSRITELCSLGARPDEWWDVVQAVEWLLGTSARPVRCHDSIWVNTALEACSLWADKSLSTISAVPNWGDPAPHGWAWSPEKEQFARYLAECDWAVKELGFLTEARLRWLMTRMSAELSSLEHENVAATERPADIDRKGPASPPAREATAGGYLGLIVDEARGEVRRAGHNHGNAVTFDVNAADWHTFLIAWRAGENGATDAQWNAGYHGEWAQRRKRKAAAGEKLAVLNICFVDGVLKLTETRVRPA